MKWLSWAEFCDNISWHSAIKRTPFKVVYGRKPTSLLSYIRGTAKAVAVEQELLHRDCIVKNLKVNPKEAQAQINKSTICFTKKSG